MTCLIILIDGLGDDPIPAWNGQTPFTRAFHPNMDRLIREGNLSQVSICEKDVVPESLTCILRLLGVPKEAFPTNRAYLELLAQNRDVSEMRWYCAVMWFPRTAAAAWSPLTAWDYLSGRWKPWPDSSVP